MPRGVAVNQRISTRDVSRVVCGLFVARSRRRDTQDRVVSLVVHWRSTAQSRAVARTRTPSATMATPRRAIHCRGPVDQQGRQRQLGRQHHGEPREEVDRRLGIECVAEKAAGDLAHWRSRHVLRLHSGRSGARTREQSPDAEIDCAMTAVRPAAEYTIGPGEAAACRCQKSTARVAEA